MNSYMVTLLTPTYNRRETLGRLFESLCAQTRQDFQWLVVDDGSSDDTEAFFRELPPHSFEVTYHKKENGGKHTALNEALPYIQGELTLILDSDDCLVRGGVEIVEKEWPRYRENAKICGMSYQKQEFTSSSFVSVADENEEVIDDHIHYRVNGHRSGDRCEIVRSEILRKYEFPVFEGERFFAESWLWNRLAYEYQTVYRNVAIYLCEYRDDGLSKAGRPLRIKCPLGMMEDCKTYCAPQVKPAIRAKKKIQYWTYGMFAGLSPAEVIHRSGMGRGMICFMPAGYMLYRIWKGKYLQNDA